ncbi:hypothetical protein [Arthrospira platensis]|uniref:hypothetical protein n=1 Tax=Limnospira TaxID=2596745 RepID=UPI0001D0E9CB|nr:hypothetical protein [Arthrospira platensis]MBD2669877.1 hypothetical protein [Arthrospira platensis FACHB-439]MBD2710447.1 hypothetical protein [Arthrospira platensis FACHB-835]MDF2211689.1 hypothetical protein [Arthrospira platensis NCB002]MDT9183289.1 hypothetical protein [Limnospira sp. PMC 289.06]MDT9294457.1 hypothetical protein [Arthrospira platensis PCC 7345]MDT9310748.1 hypothetical protein [Limnospira sp. Paracas R14]QQW29667.1 hypothetical protein AP9108_01875 [Arthrospira sp. 
MACPLGTASGATCREYHSLFTILLLLGTDLAQFKAEPTAIALGSGRGTLHNHYHLTHL